MLINRFLNRLYSQHFMRFLMYGAVLWLSVQPGLTFGVGVGVEEFATTVSKTFALVKDLLLRVAFVCGMVFAIIGLLKFKAHKDMPAQIPLSTPVVLIAVATGLLFLPTVFDLAGSAFFGDAAKPGLDLTF